MPRIAKKVKAKVTEEAPAAVAALSAATIDEPPVKAPPAKAAPEKRASRAETARSQPPKTESPKPEAVKQPPIAKPEPVQTEFSASERTVDNVKAAAQADAQRDAANYSKTNGTTGLQPPAAPFEAAEDDKGGGE